MTYDTQGRRVLQGHPSTWEDECEQLRAENERLRAALREIKRLGGLVAHDLVGRVDASKLGAVSRLSGIAHVALQEGKQCTQTT